MPAKIDLTGRRFGRLVVIDQAPHKRGLVAWNCLCDCGNMTIKTGSDLKSGRCNSCGCIRKERNNHYIHGDTHTRLHDIWSLMKDRCDNPNNKRHGSYYDRGIKVCDEWRDYRNFKKWSLENGYADNLTIDRIDNDKGYSPDNCRWTDWRTQAENRRCVRPVIQMDLDGNVIAEYPTIARASEAIGTSVTNIIHACKGDQSTAHGYKWKYKEEG